METADEIRTVLEAKAQALVTRQPDHLATLIHHEFVYVNAGGRIFDKAGYMEAYCISGRVRFAQQRITDLMVKLVDAFAIATLTISDELTIDGKEVSGRYRSLCIFSQSSGRWLWTAGQTMTIGAS